MTGRSSATDRQRPTAGRASGRPITGWSAAQTRRHGHSASRCGMLESVSSRMFTKQRVRTQECGPSASSQEIRYALLPLNRLASCSGIRGNSDSWRDTSSTGQGPGAAKLIRRTTSTVNTALASGCPQGPATYLHALQDTVALPTTKGRCRGQRRRIHGQVRRVSPQCSLGLVIQPPARHLCAKASVFCRGCLRTGGRMVPWRPGERRRPRTRSGYSCTGRA
jgi:hypothetical protein